MKTWYLLEGLDVLAPAGVGTVAAFGHSITDGFASTAAQRTGEHNTRYPDFPAQRLHAPSVCWRWRTSVCSNNLVLAT